MAKSSTKIAPNPSHKRRKPAAHKAAPRKRRARAAVHSAAHTSTKRKRRTHKLKSATHRSAARRTSNPSHAMRKHRRKSNPAGQKESLVTLVIAAGVGSGVAIGISAAAKGLLYSSFIKPDATLSPTDKAKAISNLSLVSHLAAAAAGGAAVWYGSKKRIKWLKYGGLGCMFSGVTLAVNEYAGNQITNSVLDFVDSGEKMHTKLTDNSGQPVLKGTQGFRRIAGTQGFKQISESRAATKPVEGFYKTNSSGQMSMVPGY